MSLSTEFEVFPLEVWLRILEYSSIRVHRTMSQLSSAFHKITRKRLYHTLVFGDRGYLGVTKDTAYNATWCRDLELFWDLHAERDDWQSHVHRVYIQCGKSIPRPLSLKNVLLEAKANHDNWVNELHDDSETLNWRIASLFGEPASPFQNLTFFHSTVPYMGNTFWGWEDHTPTCGITSMTLAMEDEDFGGLEWDWLDQVKYIPAEMQTLRFLELRSWSDTAHTWFESLFTEPGTWSVTHLNLLECGPLCREMRYVLQMPKKLQSLTMTSGLTPEGNRDDVDPISIQEAVETLESIKDNLVDLELDPGPSEHWIGNRNFPLAMEHYQCRAFVGFSKLQRLTAPLEMFSQSTGEMVRREDHTLYTNFPPSLQELTLVLTSRESFNKTLEQTYALPDNKVVLEDCIINLTDLSCQSDAYEKAHELFEELSQLADHKYSVPALREVHLLRDPCQWLNCEHVKQCKRQLEQAGISVHVHDRAIEGPTQDDYQRWVSEL